MKNRRHKVIREIIEQQDIETQYQLTEALLQHGFNVTQATISRDIKELGLVKVTGPGNTFRYKFQAGVNAATTFDRTKKMLRDNLLRVDVSGKILVLNTLPGTAQGVAFYLDSLNWKDILGTIAGDDTIFAVVSEKVSTESVADQIRELMA